MGRMTMGGGLGPHAGDNAKTIALVTELIAKAKSGDRGAQMQLREMAANPNPTVQPLVLSMLHRSGLGKDARPDIGAPGAGASLSPAGTNMLPSGPTGGAQQMQAASLAANSAKTLSAGSRQKGAGIVGPDRSWAETRDQMDRQATYGDDNLPNTEDDVSSFSVGGNPASAGSMTGDHPEWAGTFFGGAQPGSLDALMDPDTAFSLYKTRGGPGGGSLANSSAAQYGEDDFKAAMRLGGIMGGGINGPGDTLAFADDWMHDATGAGAKGGGQYADPGKILEQALQMAQNDPNPDNQENIILGALQAVKPYMDPTQYAMMSNRVNQVMDEYLAHGLENGMEDRSGRLLDQVYGALGM